MPIQTLAESWDYRTKASVFSELGGAGVTEWQPVVIPHDAMLHETRRDDLAHGATSGHFPGGAYQYRRTLFVPAEDEGALLTLVFEGVYRNAAVFVNGTLAGQRPSGYAEFSVRIDPYVTFGADNEIVVECRNGKDARWYSGAGIYRPVHLVTQSRMRIAHTHVRTTHLGEAEAVVEVATLVRNDGIRTARGRVSLRMSFSGTAVSELDTPVTVLPGEQMMVRQRVFLSDPVVWSAETPHLYDVSVELEREGEGVVDDRQTRFGVRTIQVDPRHGLRVNGKTVKLRGACVHHDNGVLGAATFASAEERRVRLLKAAGFNAIRSSHNPLSRAMLDACDRLGMYVMDEAFDTWTVSKTDEDYSYEFPEWWERDVESMVAKDINHPSVIFYSIGNEIPENGTPFGAVQSRKIAEHIRTLDPTRLVTNGINGFVATLDDVIAAMRAQAPSDDQASGGVNTMMAQLGDYMGLIAVSEPVTVRTEESQAVLDVAGMNYSQARYELDRDRFPERITVGTESFPTAIDEIWALVEADARVIGDFTWTGWDYIGEAGIGGIDYVEDLENSQQSVARDYPWLLAYCGDIDIIGHRRPASFYREIVFGLRTDPYIAVQRPQHHGKTVAFATPWAWSDSVSSWTWAGFENQPVHVEVYGRGDEVALLLDGEEIGRQPIGVTKAFRADFETVYRSGTLEAVSYLGGAEVGRYALHAGGTPRSLDAEVDSGADDLSFVMLALTDGRGTVITGEDQSIAVRLEGPAVLQGFGSANPKTEESFVTDRHTTFDGRALAVVRRTGRGAITLTAEAEQGAQIEVIL
ncbi:glycoside hydrolase family 2 TIM barrel-domain containing protein [Microbacterium hominis]|uniref:glycoside hydrolase family 2 TIM barrel-domain containing protein n=1 Tax=Microbacterium hominis TaxID=162426 RepID=UPI00076856BE|nr:glycoside hydrolase family 2 TIM barrel-domain containing protein [Microbacterium hominis]KXC05069.1 glycoside hydrolase [Microbacterium hominis]